MQTKTLLWRNGNIFRRKKKIFLFMLLTPIMICVMLNYMTYMAEILKSVGNSEQPLEPIGKIARCHNSPTYKMGDTPCTTIGYSIIGDMTKDASGQYKRIHELMRIVSKK